MTSPIPILSGKIKSKSRSSYHNNNNDHDNTLSKTSSSSSPRRIRPVGRGGAGNMHTQAEIQAADEEVGKRTAEQLCSSSHSSTQSTSEVKISRYRRDSVSLFSLSSFPMLTSRSGGGGGGGGGGHHNDAASPTSPTFPSSYSSPSSSLRSSFMEKLGLPSRKSSTRLAGENASIASGKSWSKTTATTTSGSSELEQ